MAGYSTSCGRTIASTTAANTSKWVNTSTRRWAHPPTRRSRHQAQIAVDAAPEVGGIRQMTFNGNLDYSKPRRLVDSRTQNVYANSRLRYLVALRRHDAGVRQPDGAGRHRRTTLPIGRYDWRSPRSDTTRTHQRVRIPRHRSRRLLQRRSRELPRQRHPAGW